MNLLKLPHPAQCVVTIPHARSLDRRGRAMKLVESNSVVASARRELAKKTMPRPATMRLHGLHMKRRRGTIRAEAR